MKVTEGHNVSVHYIGTLSDGTEFDNSYVRGETLTFTIGTPGLLIDFVDTILGMSVGDSNTVHIPVDRAYGMPRPDAIKKAPRASFAPDFQFVVGNSVQGSGPAGSFIAKIVDFNDTEVTLDLNHPLAGQDLNFQIELVSINNELEQEEPALASWTASMKKAELFEIAKQRGLPVNTRFTKAQIIEALSQ